jgi:hypothetical protein
MSTRPRGGLSPAPTAPRHRPACLLPHSTMVGNASILALAEDMARLSDSDLAEQALLLAEAAKHPALAPLVLVRLRLVAATLARRLLELEEATR